MIVSKHKKLTNITRVTVKCDFTSSHKCKKEWETVYRVIKKTRSVRDGKDCCNKCASKLSNSGSNNPSFKYPKTEEFFGSIDSEKKAYLLGWIASDGSIRDRTLHIELHNKDRVVLRLFRDSISPKSKIVKRKNRDTSYLTISSQTMIKDICKALNLTPGNKQNKIRLPLLDENLIRHFVRGFLDGDGWISLKNNKYLVCGIATIDDKLRDDLATYSAKISVLPPSINKKGIEWYGDGAYLFLGHLYGFCNFYLKRKYKNFYKYKMNRVKT